MRARPHGATAGPAASWRGHRLWCEGAGCRRRGTRRGSQDLGSIAASPARRPRALAHGQQNRWETGQSGPSGWARWSVGGIGRGEHETTSMPLRMGTPLNMTEAPLSTAKETNSGAGPNETKAMRGLVASTRSRRRRRMLTQVSWDLKGPGLVTTRLADTSGTLTRKASGSVYVVVPHPIMSLRIHGIAGSMTGELHRGYAISEGRRASRQFLPEHARLSDRTSRRRKRLALHLLVMKLAVNCREKRSPNPVIFRVHPAASPFLHSQARTAAPTLAPSLALREVSL